MGRNIIKKIVKIQNILDNKVALVIINYMCVHAYCAVV